MSGDCNIYGGFVAGSGGGTTDAVWGDITGNISNQKDLMAKLEKKVDKEENKGLSSNDFTNKNKEKLDKLNTIFEFSLSPDRWELFNDNIYTQIAYLEAIRANDTAVAEMSFSEDEILCQKELEYWSSIFKIELCDCYIKTYVTEKIPDISLNIRIKI